jgi:glutamine---fructose-6-phosphate transaminase (isomerizing)
MMTEEMDKTLKQENKRRTQHPYCVWESVQSIPDMLTMCLEEEVNKDLEKIVQECDRRSINKIVLLGRGSSYFAALAASFLIKKITQLPVSCHVTNVFGSYPYEKCDSKTAVFFLSHSGKSEGDVPIVEAVRRMGAYTVGVTDIPESGLGKVVDQLFIGPGGSKVEIPATRTYSTAMYRMMLLALSLGKNSATTEEIAFYQQALAALPDQMRTFIPQYEKDVSAVVETLKDCKNIIVVGFGPNHANAEEAAMALNQSTGIPSESYELENYIHGPMQALTKDAGMIGIAPDGALQNRMFSMITAAGIIGAKTVLLAPAGTDTPKVDQLVELPADIPDLISPVAYMIPMWQTGYHVGLLGHGAHPDRLSMDKEEFIEAFSYIMKADKWVTKK